MSADFEYDAATDSLYIKLRPGESVDNRIISDDVVIDLGADGEPLDTTSSMPANMPMRFPRRWAISISVTQLSGLLWAVMIAELAMRSDSHRGQGTI